MKNSRQEPPNPPLPLFASAVQPPEQPVPEPEPPKSGQLEQPPTLRRVCSMSTGQSAEDFFRLIKENGITAVADIRHSRKYQWANWSHERDVEYICRMHGVTYVVLDDLMPTQGMRNVLATQTEANTGNRAECHETWTRYQESMVALLEERKFLTKEGPVKNLLHGTHEAVAMVCNCHHHLECHRSVVLGVIAKYVPGVNLHILYPGEKPPSRNADRKLLRDIPRAGLSADPQPKKRRK